METKRPCLSCVESSFPGHPAKHDKGCREDSAYRNKSIQWVKLTRKLLYPAKPQKWEGFSFMPKGEVQ